MKEDRNLVKQLQKGEEEAFNRIYERYSRLIYHIVFSILENRDDSNDIVQETFMTIIDKINTFNYKNNFKSWIIRIAKNKALDFIRKHSRIESGVSVDDFESNQCYERKKTDFELMLNQYRNVINRDEFNVITLYIFHQLRFSEIAVIYNKTQSAVNNIYYRGINKIKKSFERAEQNEQKNEKLF